MYKNLKIPPLLCGEQTTAKTQISLYTQPVQDLNPFMPNGFFSLNHLDQSISNIRDVWVVFIITMFYRNSNI